ncbi:MAG: NAD-dependent epimerase/dehydratase family protein [Chloroflexota bacterium]
MVTGGLGFIGSNLAARLVDLGANVLIVDSRVPETGANPFNIVEIQDRLSTRDVDVRDALAMERLVQGQDLIFNLAGQLSHIDSMRDPFTDLDINCRAQLSLLEACRHHNPRVKIVFASTRQFYGRPDYLPVDEKHLLHPTDVNGINKMAGEWYHILYNNVYGLRACSLRLSNTYGPRMLVRNNRQTFLGWMIRQVLDSEEIQIFGDGTQLRDMMYVDDVVEAFLLAGASDVANGQVFNLGGPEPLSLRSIVETLIEAAGDGSYRLVPFPEDKKAIDIGSFYSDFTKIQRALGWQPRVALQDGLERTIAFYRANREQYWNAPATAPVGSPA